MYVVDWKLVFLIIDALGSIATLGGFLYLFVKDKEKQVQIDKLTAIAGELTQMKAIDNERLNLSVKPDFYFKTMTSGAEGLLDIRIINKGEKAKIIKVDLKSDDLLYNESLSCTLDKNTEKPIFFQTKGEKHINDCEYRIYIHYTDKINNLYIIELKGVGGRIEIVETKLIKPKNFQ